MGVRKNIVIGLFVGFVGMGLISGGTVAYFNTTVETQSNIKSGVLKLDISEVDENGVLFQFENKKPGDIFDYRFHLKNTGTLDMQDITLVSAHEMITGVKSFSEQIRLNKLVVGDEHIIEHVTLKELQEMTEEEAIIILERLNSEDPEVEVIVEFEFLRTNDLQNEYQGNVMELYWTFEAIQTDD